MVSSLLKVWHEIPKKGFDQHMDNFQVLGSQEKVLIISQKLMVPKSWILFKEQAYCDLMYESEPTVPDR